jgi:hypothetical protein
MSNVGAFNIRQGVACQIRTAIAGNHSANTFWEFRRCDKRCAAAGARTEEANAQIPCLLQLFCPPRRAHEPVREQALLKISKHGLD